MRGSDALIHLVGIISEARHRTFYQAHVATTAKVLEAAGRCGIRRVVHMSALGTRSGARSGYHRTKWEGEELVRASGLDWTILRPSLIYGPDDHFTTLFARISRWSPVLPVMGEGRALLQPVSVGTVARAFVHAVPCREAVGQTLDLCGPERLTFPALLRQIGEACGRRRRLFHIPMSVARLQARAFEICLGSVLGVPPPLNRDQLLMLEEDNIGDGTEADRLFGLVHPTLRDALRGQFAGSRG
jgi:NADH dehydrogenase